MRHHDLSQHQPAVQRIFDSLDDPERNFWTVEDVVVASEANKQRMGQCVPTAEVRHLH